MNKVKMHFLAFTAFLSSICLMQCQKVEETLPNDASLNNIRSEIQELVSTNTVASLSVGVYQRGEVIWKESFGWADKENKIESTTNTVYALGSLSKSITGTLTHILADKKVLSLNDRVGIASSSGLENFPSVKQLLQMEGGISHQYKYYNSYSLDSIAKDFKDFGFVAFEPGSVYHYSNLSYGLIDKYITKMSGKPMHEILYGEMLLPLNMTMTYGDKMLIPSDAEIAKGYFDDGSLVPSNRFEPRGGGGFYSSVTDLLEYGKYHIYNEDTDEKQLMNENLFNSMHSTSLDQKNKFYCNGWANLPLSPERNLLLSNGAIAGAATSLIVIPEDDLVIVCLSNTSVGNSTMDDIAFKIAGALIKNFTSQLEKTMKLVEHAFEPIEYIATPQEIGTWQGSIYLDSDTIPITISISKDEIFKVRISDGAGIRIEEIYREQGLVSANLKGINSIGNKILSNYYMTFRLQFSDQKGNGVLFLNSKEDLPSGLPYWVFLTKK